MTAKPKFRNFFKHDYLIGADRSKAWTREALNKIGSGREPIWDSYIFVLSPSHQWVFVDHPTEFGRVEFCDWLETVTGCAIIDRNRWPDLELAAEPPEDWDVRAREMPCRTGPGLWDKLTPAELHRYIRGGGLPDDVEERGKPDDVQ